MPREKPAMTEFSTETAARAMVLTWPEKTCVMAPREYWQTEVKMAGAPRYQSFLDSTRNSLAKSEAPAIGAMSSDSAVKTAVSGSGVRSGCVWRSLSPMVI
ncbi:hypothetical protein VIGAN_01244900 [Vigna angularis var. angularis]|uniref:Uncharacterized protein n=1 Tax=Vigna angularis var. angularis TaxID=157739 RepID=A0A0S3R293_PHAAN|nr:hypothetical protein VIGAN_01244900 [Vigna angularis var. angularis]